MRKFKGEGGRGGVGEREGGGQKHDEVRLLRLERKKRETGDEAVEAEEAESIEREGKV